MIHYFISDLHLSNKRLDLIQAFVSLTKLLKSSAANHKNSQLHIVGDFYEAWIGDDFNAPWNDEVESSLRELSNFGMIINVYHGNRDFLLGQTWADRVGANLINESMQLNQPPYNLLISHGDETCLDDVDYQQFRRMVRQEQWQKQVLSMPLAQRMSLASKLREDSKESNSEKMLDIMDVDLHEIDRLMQLTGSNLMIHGHTHRPSLHQQITGNRLVLGDWDASAWLAILDHSNLAQYKISLATFNQENLTMQGLIDEAEQIHYLDI